MKREYAVYTEDAKVDGIYDNDLMDWFTDYEEAKSFAIEKSKQENVEVYLSEVDDGDFADKSEIYIGDNDTCMRRILWSVELEANSWCDDSFNGTYDECIDYCNRLDYKIDGIEARLAKVLIENNCVMEVLEIVEEL